MVTTVEDLTKRALELSPEQRVQLADDLVQSLDAQALTELDKSWITESKRRRDEVRSSYSDAISGPQALQQVRDAVKQLRGLAR